MGASAIAAGAIPRRERPPRATLLLLAAWLALTVIGTSVHVTAWTGASAGTRWEWITKVGANASQAANAPLWLGAWRAGFGRGIASALLVNAVGWGFWAVIARALWSAWKSGRCRLAGSTLSQNQPPDPSRRRFPADITRAGGAVTLGGTGARATMWTPWSLEVRRYSVPIAGLPRALEGLRLVQLTDTHLGPRVPGEFISEAVELALSLKPDLFVLTGDYVHNAAGYIDRAAALFGPLLEDGAIGTIGVLGNHDHYAGARAMSGALASRGVHMIDNGRVFVDAQTRRIVDSPRDGTTLCVAGLGDLNEDVIDVKRALAGVPNGVPRIVLAHNPDTAEIGALVSGAPRPRVDLMLCGHTHGGQVSLPLVGPPVTLSSYGQKYAHGLVRGPACPVLVSAGIGMSILPIRIGVPPEVVEVTLRGTGLPTRAFVDRPHD